MHRSGVTGWKALAGAVGLGAVASLAGCVSTASTPGAAITFNHLESAYHPGEVGYAAGERDLPVEVRGNPFAKKGVSDEALGDRVIAAMDAQPGWFRTNYTTRPGESARKLYRVSWVFGADGNTSLYTICAGSGAPADGGDVVLAGFCRGDRALSYLMGSLSGVASPEDPRFRNFIRVATRVLLPNRDPNRDGGREDFDQ